jgi:hypothetical protein
MIFWACGSAAVAAIRISIALATSKFAFGGCIIGMNGVVCDCHC